jgi:hypothetical protein
VLGCDDLKDRIEKVLKQQTRPGGSGRPFIMVTGVTPETMHGGRHYRGCLLASRCGLASFRAALFLLKKQGSVALKFAGG